MFKNIAKFEFTVMDRVYQVLCDVDSPLEHFKEAIFQMQKVIGQMEDVARAQAEAAKAQAEAEKPQEELPVTDEVVNDE